MHLLLEWELVFFAWQRSKSSTRVYSLQPLAPAPALALALASAPAPALLNWGRGKTSWGRQFGMPLSSLGKKQKAGNQLCRPGKLSFHANQTSLSIPRACQSGS